MKFPVHLQNTPSEILNHGLVQYLLVTIEDPLLKINRLEAEVRLLKGHSATPVIPPSSNLEGVKSYSCKEVKKTPFSKRAKKSSLIIHTTKRISATNVPKGSVFKEYKKSIRQDLHISAVNTCYELESWQTPATQRLL